jgi:PAS domain S-box-containing protein
MTQNEGTEVSDDLLLKGIEEMPGGFVITDPKQPDNPIVYASPGFVALTGYDTDAIVGRNCRFLQGPKTDSSVVTDIRNAIDNGDPIATIIRNYRNDGDPFWNQLFIIPIFDDDRNLIAFFGFQRDITDHLIVVLLLVYGYYQLA